MLIDDLKIKAQNGNKEAQYELGCLYSYGDETQHASLDPKEALKWFHKSAKQGYAPAFNAIGIAYDNGEGVRRNLKKAFKWIKKAADAEYVVALRNIAVGYREGDIVKKDLSKCEIYYSKAFLAAKEQAVRDDKCAQYVLGVCYEFGNGGAEQNVEEAVKWYQKAAEHGHLVAQTNLGACYEQGDGVEKNLPEAVKWYRKAAYGGHARAQVNLGVCYEYGSGVEKNVEEAFKWYQKAAVRNYARGQCFLAECYEHGIGTEVNIKKAFNLYKKASDRGFDRAQYYLAECYRYGKGVRENKKRAIDLYKKAAAQGNEQANYAVVALTIELNETLYKSRIKKQLAKLDRQRRKLKLNYEHNSESEIISLGNNVQNENNGSIKAPGSVIKIACDEKSISEMAKEQAILNSDFSHIEDWIENHKPTNQTEYHNLVNNAVNAKSGIHKTIINTQIDLYQKLEENWGKELDKAKKIKAEKISAGIPKSKKEEFFCTVKCFLKIQLDKLGDTCSSIKKCEKADDIVYQKNKFLEEIRSNSLSAHIAELIKNYSKPKRYNEGEDILNVV